MLYLIAGDQPSAGEALQLSLANLDLDLPPTPSFSSIEVRTAEIKFRLAEGRPELAARRTDDLLDYLECFHIRQFRSDALFLKAQALLTMGMLKEANEFLFEAYREAEALSTKPTLWRILDFQGELLERLGEPDQAVSKRDKAHTILMTLAGSIVEEADRITFLDLPDVRRVLEYQGGAST